MDSISPTEIGDQIKEVIFREVPVPVTKDRPVAEGTDLRASPGRAKGGCGEREGTVSREELELGASSVTLSVIPFWEDGATLGFAAAA